MASVVVAAGCVGGVSYEVTWNKDGPYRYAVFYDGWEVKKGSAKDRASAERSAKYHAKKQGEK